MIKNIIGHGPVCHIPKFMEIESLVLRDKVFKAFQNIYICFLLVTETINF